MENTFKEIEELVRRHYAMLEKQRPDQIDRVSLSAPAFDAREALRAIRTILDGWISQGPNVREFEREFAKYIGSSRGVAVNSGSSANLLALLALKEVNGLQDGDEVIVPAATFATVAMPIVQVGLVPVYVDVCRDTLNIDPDEVAKGISKKTRVLMPVHTLGYPADMPRLMKVAAEHRLLVLEDCCEAHGSTIHGKKVGSYGDIAAFSFFVAHNMTTGEGGMLVTEREALEVACRSMREFGRCDQRSIASNRVYSDDVLVDFDRRYVFDRIGYNLRMTDIAAAFGIEQLAKLEDMNRHRRANASLLKKLLAESAGPLLELSPEQDGYVHTYYTFPIVLNEKLRCTRREFAEHLESKGIETRPLFAGCLPDQPAFRQAPGRVVGKLPQARFLRDRLVFIGIHPALDERHMHYVADTVAAFLRSKGG